MKIKIIKSDAKEYEGTILNLIQTDEMVWIDEKEQITIIDGYSELLWIPVIYKAQKCKDFFQLHIFFDNGDKLVWIYEVRYII